MWPGGLSVEVSRSHTHTPCITPLNLWSAPRTGRYIHNTHTHTLYNPSVQMISSSHRPLHTHTQHTANTTEEHPWPQRDSNWRTERSSGRRPAQWTARPPSWMLLDLQHIALGQEKKSNGKGRQNSRLQLYSSSTVLSVLCQTAQSAYH
jgi:hypothetical protein